MKHTNIGEINQFTTVQPSIAEPVTRSSSPKLDIFDQDKTTIRIFRGTEAETLLGDADFCAAWQKLYENCAWATTMQSPIFLRIWHKVYRESFELVFIVEFSADKSLGGLLILAIKDGKLVQAGGYHAEYQTWLATEENGNSFIVKALETLAENFPNENLQFLFLAPNTPLEWLKTSKFGNRSDLRIFPRPLVKIGDGSETAASLRKKGNKSKMRQMRKFGEISLVEMSDAAELEACFDEFELYGAIRRGAIHNNFEPSDKLKKTFFLELRKNSNLLYPTALKLAEKIISIQFNFRNREDLMFGMIGYLPEFAWCSPNKFHILFLCLKLVEQGVPNLDLTPGGDEYKIRHATHFDETHALTIFFSRAAFLKYQAKRHRTEIGKNLLEKVGIDRKKFDEKLNLFNHKRKLTKIAKLPANLLNIVRKKIADLREMRIYSLEKAQIENIPQPTLMRPNNFVDVFNYEPQEAWQMPKNLFLHEVLQRIENGSSIYTYAENNALLHSGWLMPTQEKSFIAEVETWFYPLPNSAVLFDYYSHPKARGRGLYQNSLRQMIHAAFEKPETERVYIGVLADNAPSRHVIEKVGFQYQFSFFREINFGKKTFRTNAPEEVTRSQES